MTPKTILYLDFLEGNGGAVLPWNRERIAAFRALCAANGHKELKEAQWLCGLCALCCWGKGI